jgi:hypothetical protein
MPLYKLSYLVFLNLPSNDFFGKIPNDLAYRRLLMIGYSIDMINEGFFLIFGKALDLFWQECLPRAGFMLMASYEGCTADFVLFRSRRIIGFILGFQISKRFFYIFLYCKDIKW